MSIAGTVLVDVLPAAVGVALSPVPIVGAILVLDTPLARRTGPAFAAGWALGLLAVSTLVVLVTESAEGADGGAPGDSGTSTVVDVATLLFGLLLLGLAVKQWRGRPQPDEEAPTPAWMTRVSALAPGRALGLGAVLAGANPKSFALAATAAAAIAEASLSSGGDAVALAAFVGLGSATVAGPVLAYLVVGERARPALDRARRFMTAHGTVIGVVISLALGTKLVADGITGLAA